MSYTLYVAPSVLEASADVILRSIERGDWEEEFCDEIAPVAGELRRAAAEARPVVLEVGLAGELWAILGSDVVADSILRPMLEALEGALGD